MKQHPVPIIIRYETNNMHAMRQRLTIQGFSDEAVDIFKNCLIALERQGLHLVGELK